MIDYVLLIIFAVYLLAPIVGLLLAGRARRKKSGKRHDDALLEIDGITYYDKMKSAYFKVDEHPSPKEGWKRPRRKSRFWSFIAWYILQVGAIWIYEKYIVNKMVLWVWAALFAYATILCVITLSHFAREYDKKAETSENPRKVYRDFWYVAEVRFALVLAPWVKLPFWWRQKSKMRNKADYYCPKCHRPLSEYAGFQLNNTERFEERLKSIKYFPYRCDEGHVFIVKDIGTENRSYGKCNKCGGFTAYEVGAKQVRRPRTRRTGKLKVSYSCQNCGHQFVRLRTIPKLKEENHIGRDVGNSVVDTVLGSLSR